MAECCGEERGTPFCPLCGKELRVPLMSFVRHCRTSASKVRKQLKAYIVRVGDKSRSERGLKRQAQLEGRIKKWESWADDLEKLIGEVR